MLYETDSADLIRFATRWASLGDAIAEQVERVVTDPLAAAGLRPERADLEVNSNAIKLAQERLEGLNGDLDEAFAHYFNLLAEARG